jgi:hypothetical protein
MDVPILKNITTEASLDVPAMMAFKECRVVTVAGVEMDCAKILDPREEPEEDRPTTSDETGYACGGRRKAVSAAPKLLVQWWCSPENQS